jgi:hypothetical protein
MGRMTLCLVITAAMFFALLTGCVSRDNTTYPEPGMRGSQWVISTIPDPEPERVHNIVYVTIPPLYLIDRAEDFAEMGIDGFFVNRVMGGWESDIWALPSRWVPDALDAPEGRIVGESNPLLQLCKRMNERSNEAGIRYNSISLAYHKPLPDWFDDAAWSDIVENFRQAAIFARMGGFAGVTLDVEYIAQIYALDYEAYLVPGYPRDRLRDQARLRGRELAAAMIAEFPEMVNWHLPTSIEHYGPLANDHFIGMVEALAAVDAPGGMHISSEMTYQMTGPTSIVNYMAGITPRIQDSLRVISDDRTLDYWNRRCTVSPGLWPLGYYRPMTDETGALIGYAGKKETFGDSLVGSMADKTENHSALMFRNQYATARLGAKQFMWIYSHGPTLWQMAPEEMVRYNGNRYDTLATISNLDEYVATLRDRPIIAPGPLQDDAIAARSGQLPQHLVGYPDAWWHIGPFPMPSGTFADEYGPETGVDLSETLGILGTKQTWQRVNANIRGGINLMTTLGGQDSVFAYSAVWAETNEARAWNLSIGRNDFAAVYINSEEVYHRESDLSVEAGTDVVPVHLPAGRSEILVKTGNTRGAGWGFMLRFINLDGTAAEGIRYVSPEH